MYESVSIDGQFLEAPVAEVFVRREKAADATYREHIGIAVGVEVDDGGSGDARGLAAAIHGGIGLGREEATRTVAQEDDEAVPELKPSNEIGSTVPVEVGSRDIFGRLPEGLVVMNDLRNQDSVAIIAEKDEDRIVLLEERVSGIGEVKVAVEIYVEERHIGVGRCVDD